MGRVKFDVHVLVLCTAVIVLSILITPSTETLTLWGYTLPPMCVYIRAFLILSVSDVD